MANIYTVYKLYTSSCNFSVINIVESDKFKSNLQIILYTELSTIVIHTLLIITVRSNTTQVLEISLNSSFVSFLEIYNVALRSTYLVIQRKIAEVYLT
jgi:hypothetical protein